MGYQAILNKGVLESNTKEVNDKIIITNFVAILLSLLSTPFTVICLLWVPEGWFLGLLFILVSCIAIICNLFHQYSLGKIFIVYGSPIVCFWFSIMVMYPDPYIGFSPTTFLIGIFFLSPWLLYGLEHKIKLVSGCLYVLFLVFMLSTINDLLPIPLSDTYVPEVFTNGWGVYLSVGTFFMFYGVTLYYFLWNNRNSIVQNEKLLDSMNTRTSELEEANQKTDDFIAELEAKRKGEKRRSWVDKGLSDFSVLLRENERIDLLYQNIITKLVRYLDASQGGLYIINSKSEQPYLDLVSSSSYTLEQLKDTKIELGESLIGRVAIDKELMVLDNVPSDFYKISSGLGEAIPTSVIVVPMISNEEVVGVFELATFKSLDKYSIEFLEKVAETLASTLGTLQNNEKNRILLEESRTAAQNFKQQEAGLIEMIEELQFAQDSQHAKEVEHLEKIKELEEKLANQ